MIIEDRTKKYYSVRLGFKVMNKEAEYEAVLAGFVIAETLGTREVKMKVDSQGVVGQIIGDYLTKGEKLNFL